MAVGQLALEWHTPSSHGSVSLEGVGGRNGTHSEVHVHIRGEGANA